MPSRDIKCLLLTLHLWLCLWLCAADLCDWSGRDLTRDPDSRTVLQVRLRCTAGSVEWVRPGLALRVVLEPNLSSANRTTACIKPFVGFRQASVYLERAGVLELLITDPGRPEQVFCYRADGAQRPAIYIQVHPQRILRPRAEGFRYELLWDQNMMSPVLHRNAKHDSCQPCNDTELLMAVCSSDFVIRGFIRSVSHDPERQTSLVELSGGRVYRQRSGVFIQEVVAGGGGAVERRAAATWCGSVRTPLQCGARVGAGEFLFTGSEHFGEAWLDCAPRYPHFLSLYRAAWSARRHFCDFPLD